MEYTNDKTRKFIESGNINELDYPEFWYNWDPSASLSKNFELLLTALTITKVEFTTDIDMPEPPFHHMKYLIQSVIIKGPPVHIQWGLKNILNSVVKKLEAFSAGIEGNPTKLIELTKSKWTFKQWYYHTKMDREGLFHPEVEYTLRFKDDKYAVLPYNLFIFSQQAEHEMTLHHSIRWDFLEILLACIDLQIDKLKYLTPAIEKFTFVKNKEKEDQLLQVWIALKQSKFLDFIKGTGNELWTEARLRDKFFSVFNLECRDYNQANRALKRLKKKDGFLLKMHEFLEKYVIKNDKTTKKG